MGRGAILGPGEAIQGPTIQLLQPRDDVVSEQSVVRGSIHSLSSIKHLGVNNFSTGEQDQEDHELLGALLGSVSEKIN